CAAGRAVGAGTGQAGSPESQKIAARKYTAPTTIPPRLAQYRAPSARSRPGQHPGPSNNASNGFTYSIGAAPPGDETSSQSSRFHCIRTARGEGRAVQPKATAVP